MSQIQSDEIQWIPAADLPAVQGQVDVPFKNEELALYADTGELDHATFAFAVNAQSKLAILAARLNNDPKHRTESMGTNLCIRAAMIESHMLAKPFCRSLLNTPRKKTPLRFKRLRRLSVEWLRMPMPATLELTEIPEGYLEDDFLRHDPDVLFFLQSVDDLARVALDAVGSDFHKAMIRTAASKYNYELAARAAMKEAAKNPMETQEIADA